VECPNSDGDQGGIAVTHGFATAPSGVKPGTSWPPNAEMGNGRGIVTDVTLP
jgi:hypothetical protein